jgi:hypothetical protein
MPLQYTTETDTDFTTLVIAGSASMEAFALLTAQAGEESRQRRDRRLLVDLTGVEGSLAFTEQFRLGQIAAAHFGHLLRLASLVPEDKLTRTSEKVALSMGVQLRVFASREQAVLWLGSE